MQGRGWIPRLETHACDQFAGFTGGVQRHWTPVTQNCMALWNQTLGFHLNFFYRRINISRGSLRAHLFTQNVPGFNSKTQFQLNITNVDLAVTREAELDKRSKPLRIKSIATAVQVGSDFPN